MGEEECECLRNKGSGGLMMIFVFVFDKCMEQ